MSIYVFQDGIVEFTPFEELTTDLDSAVRAGCPVTAVLTSDLAAILDLFSDFVEYVRPLASNDAEADALMSRAEVRR